jgi:hypothetical protein
MGAFAVRCNLEEFGSCFLLRLVDILFQRAKSIQELHFMRISQLREELLTEIVSILVN